MYMYLNFQKDKSIFFILISESRFEHIFSHDAEDSIFEWNRINMQILDGSMLTSHHLGDCFYV